MAEKRKLFEEVGAGAQVRKAPAGGLIDGGGRRGPARHPHLAGADLSSGGGHDRCWRSDPADGYGSVDHGMAADPRCLAAYE